MEPLRIACVGLIVAVFCLAVGGYVVVHWVERQILTTDNWVALVAPLPKQKVISEAMGRYIGQQVFAAAPVEQRVKAALPPRAAFLAKPLTSQLQTLTTRVSQRLVASDAFRTIWEGANRLAMNRLLSVSRGQTPPLQAKVDQKFNIDLSSVAGQLRQKLGATSAALPALQPAAKRSIQLSTDLQTRPKRLQQIVQTIDKLSAVLPFVILLTLVGALALSRNRWRSALIMLLLVFVFMLIELIALKWGRQQTLDQVRDPANLSAVGYVFDTLISWLKQMINTVLIVTGVLVVLLWLAGPAAWASQLRNQLHLTGWRQSRWWLAWQAGRRRIPGYERYAWLLIGLAVLICLALIEKVSSITVINAVLLALSVGALIHIVATPPLPELSRPDRG